MRLHLQRRSPSRARQGSRVEEDHFDQKVSAAERDLGGRLVAQEAETVLGERYRLRVVQQDQSHQS